MSINGRNAVSATIAAVLFTSCIALPKLTPVDPSADFAAHLGYFGIVIDRMDGGQTAAVVHAHASGGPAYLLESNHQTIAALWMTDNDDVTVRRAPDATASLVGEVRASWQGGIVRVTLEPAGDASLHTSRFVRVSGENFPHTLVRNMSVQDLPGVYRAELRDAQGAAVGWLRVTILPYQGLPRDYDAFVPERLDGPLLVAAVALMDSELDSIIDRNAFPSDRSPGGLLGAQSPGRFSVASENR